jgi:hypothetical protein
MPTVEELIAAQAAIIGTQVPEQARSTTKL